MNPSLDTALELLSNGIAAIPTTKEKQPRVSAWKKYQSTLPDGDEVRRWFGQGGNLAIICGSVKCLDVDEKNRPGLFDALIYRCHELELDHIVQRLVRQRTPSGGRHLVWRCEDAGKLGNVKLASRPTTAEEQVANPHERVRVMIETRGTGGYFLCAPSDGYVMEQGDWSFIPFLSEDEQSDILAAARSLDEVPPPEAHESPKATTQPTADGATPGDDFDARAEAELPALLTRHGWTRRAASKYWTRPGKKTGISASFGVVPNRFWVFSTSTQFEVGHVYRPWHVFAVLECNGDFSAASGALRRLGFGGKRQPKQPAYPPLPSDYYRPAIEVAPEDGIPASGNPPGAEGIEPGAETHPETEEEKIRRLLSARAFDMNREPPPLRPVFELGGVVICTPGNLTAITAQAKVGKSALVSALTAASMTDPSNEEADLLTAKGFNAHGKGLLYFDTEQSPDDFWHAVNRAKRRACVDFVPDWLHAYSIADLPAGIGRKAVSVAMEDAAAMHGGVFAVIIDGVADLVLDVNSAEECNGIVAELHMLAIKHDCPILGVIHKNPGSEKVRGHLGSQLERKAETNLTLDKEDGVTVVWSAKQRRAPIDKKTGPRFAWSDQLKMHVTVPAAEFQSAKPRALADLEVLVAEIFEGGKRFRYSEIVREIERARDRPTSTAKKQTNLMIREGLIAGPEMGYYSAVGPRTKQGPNEDQRS